MKNWSCKTHEAIFLLASVCLLSVACKPDMAPPSYYIYADIDSARYENNFRYPTLISSSCCIPSNDDFHEEGISFSQQWDSGKFEGTISFIVSKKDSVVNALEAIDNYITRKKYDYVHLTDPKHKDDGFFKSSGIKITLSYNDARKSVFNSALKAQPHESYFSITEVERTGDENSGPKYIITGSFSCTLYNTRDENRKRKITNGIFKLPLWHASARQ